MLGNIVHHLRSCQIGLLIFIPSLIACSPESQTTVTAAEKDATLWQTVQIDGVEYYKGAAKASATTQSDLSIELSYVIRGGQAHIDAVKIGGVEYRADCASGAPEAPERQPGGSSVPHYQYCEDGVGIRDIDFTCAGLRNPPPPREEPGPEHIRLKVQGNEEYLRKRFENAIVQEVLGPVPRGESYTTPSSFNTTYNLTDGDDDFFFLDIQHKAEYTINTYGQTDTWGDLYLDDNGTIKPIAGAGGVGFFVATDDGSFEGNLYMSLVLEPGEYYLRVAPETEGVTGTYTVWAVGFELE